MQHLVQADHHLARSKQSLSAAAEAYQQAAEALLAQGDLDAADQALAKAKECGYVKPSPVAALCKQGRFQEAAVEQRAIAKGLLGHDQAQAYSEAAQLFGLANAPVQANQCELKAAKRMAWVDAGRAMQMFFELAEKQDAPAAADSRFKASLCALACDLNAEVEMANEFAVACKNRDRDAFTQAAVALDDEGRLDCWTTAMLYTIKCSLA